MNTLIDANTCIAALAPSGAYNEANLQQGLQILRDNGFDVEVFAQAPTSHRYLAGTDEYRMNQLIEAFTNPKYGAVWAIRGVWLNPPTSQLSIFNPNRSLILDVVSCKYRWQRGFRLCTDPSFIHWANRRTF